MGIRELSGNVAGEIPFFCKGVDPFKKKIEKDNSYCFKCKFVLRQFCFSRENVAKLEKIDSFEIILALVPWEVSVYANLSEKIPAVKCRCQQHAREARGYCVTLRK